MRRGLDGLAASPDGTARAGHDRALRCGAGGRVRGGMGRAPRLTRETGVAVARALTLGLGFARGAHGIARAEAAALCEELPACAAQGLCTLAPGGLCAAVDEDDCWRADVCERLGACTPHAGYCLPAAAEESECLIPRGGGAARALRLRRVLARRRGVYGSAGPLGWGLSAGGSRHRGDLLPRLRPVRGGRRRVRGVGAPPLC
jgi:hypothetical protein